MARSRLLFCLMLAGFGCSADGTGSSRHLSQSTVTICQGVYCPNIDRCPDGSRPATQPGECCETCGGGGGGSTMCDPSFGICQADSDCPQPATGAMVTITCRNGCCIPSDPNPCPISLPCPDGSVPVYWDGMCQCREPPIPGQCCDGTFGECMTATDCPSFPGANVACINGCCTPGGPPPPCDPRNDPNRCCICPQPPPCMDPAGNCPPSMCECPPPPPPPCDPRTNPMCGCVCPLEPCMVNPDGSVTCPPCDCPPPCDPSTGQNCCSMGDPNCPPPPCPDPNDPRCCAATGNCPPPCMPGDPNCPPPPCMPGDPNCPPPPPPPCDPNTDPMCCIPDAMGNCVPPPRPVRR